MEIQQNISLQDKNWFKTGGKSKYFCQPTNEIDFIDAIKYANNNNLNIFILGKGANLVINDEGFDGITINPKLNNISIKKDSGSSCYLTAEAGIEIQNLIDYCLDNCLIGLEDFSNIPGTIGGAIFINIHYFNKFISDNLIKAKVINKKTTKIIEVNKDWFKFGYDNSMLQENKYFLINATFKLTKVSDIKAAYAKGRRDEIIKYRKRQYPTNNTCGCFFRNFHEKEVDLKINNKKMIFIAYYLDKLGIKGNLKIGKASISYKHANMIITDNGATSTDILNLARKMQYLVFKNYGILPQAECQFIGFKTDPLLNIKNIQQYPKKPCYFHNQNIPLNK